MKNVVGFDMWAMAHVEAAPFVEGAPCLSTVPHPTPSRGPRQEHHTTSIVPHPESGAKVVKNLLPAVNPDYKYLQSDLASIRTTSPQCPWEEFNWDQVAIVEGLGHGMGCFADDDSKWFGGKIQQ